MSCESLTYETMSDESKVDFSRAETCFFLSLKDCPIPSGLYLNLVEDNIRSALDDMGYNGYCAQTEIYGTNGKDVDVHRLIFDIINFAVSRYPEPMNLMVISKRISEASEFFRVLRALRLRGCNVLLVEPPDSGSESMFETAESVINCTKLLDGGDPRIKICESSDEISAASSDSWETDSDYDE